jgi:hypothetical protein
MALKIQYSAGDIEREIEARATQGRESVVAKRDLGRYYSLLRRSLPTFTIGEARVIMRAVTEAAAPSPGRRGRDEDGGFRVDPPMLWAYVARMKDVVEDDRARRAEILSRVGVHLNADGRVRMEPFPHAEVDVDELIARLRLLTFAEALAVVDAVERVASEYSDENGQFEFDPPYMGFSFTELVGVGLVAAGDQTFDVIAYRYEPADLGIEPDGLDLGIVDRKAAARDLDWMERIEEIAAGPFRTEKDARAAATKLRTAEGDGPRRFVVRDSRDRGMLRSAQREEEAAVV